MNRKKKTYINIIIIVISLFLIASFTALIPITSSFDLKKHDVAVSRAPLSQNENEVESIAITSSNKSFENTLSDIKNKQAKYIDANELAFNIHCGAETKELCKELISKKLIGNSNLKDVIAIVISVFAFIVSIGGHFYTYRKDNKSRLRSINDDFWIRKIVSPVSIEPLIKDILDIVANLPDDCSHAHVPKDAYRNFTEKYHPKIQSLACNLMSLKLLDPLIYEKSRNNLYVIEDLVLEYCGQNSLGIRTLKAETSDKIIEAMLAILSSLKEYQTTSV